jgi:hypothetical protein
VFEQNSNFVQFFLIEIVTARDLVRGRYNAVLKSGRISK